MPKKKGKEEKPEVHKDLEGLDVNINELGEIEANYDVDDINKFLNKNVDDKKLRDRDLDLEDDDIDLDMDLDLDDDDDDDEYYE